MSPETILFWLLAVITLISGLIVITVANPIFSALALAMTMVGVAAFFVTLQAYFLAGVQLIVYAGAVMVLFVMVLMLFDLKNEIQAFTRGKISGFIKVLSVALLAGLVVGSILATSYMISETDAVSTMVNQDNSKALGKILFTQYLFGFEALGILLLVVAVGAVALARSKGGTHAQH